MTTYTTHDEAKPSIHERETDMTNDKATYVTRHEAIQREIIEPLTDYVADHDIEAIADEVLDTTGEGTNYRYVCVVDTEEFWRVVMNNNWSDKCVHLPDLLRGGHRPWTGAIGELIDHHRDSDMTAMIDRATAAGLYREDEESGRDIYDVLPQLLATDLEALREFADDPNATYTSGLRLRWDTWENPGLGGINVDGTSEPDKGATEGATLFLERAEDGIWCEIDSDGFEFDADHPADDAAPYEAVEKRMRIKHSLPADIEIEMSW